MLSEATKRVRYLLLIIALGFLASGCELYENVLDQFVEPEIRDKPQKPIQIEGKLDPGLTVEFRVLYTTTKKSCRRTVNWLMGAKSDRRYSVEYPVSVTSAGYRVTVELDKIHSGYCQWSPFSIDYTVKKNGKPHYSPIPPTPFIWLKADGVDHLPEYDIECEDWLYRGFPGFYCRRSLGPIYISDNTKSAIVHIRERHWFGTKQKSSGQS